MPIKAHIVKTMVFPVVKYECESWPVKKRRAPKNSCFWTTVLEKTLESPFNCKEIKPVIPKGKWTLNIHWKDWCWSWSSNTLATRCEEPPHWKRSWCWERLRAGGVEGDDRGWDSWMIPPVQRTWTWANSRRWWGTGRPGELQSMGSQRVWHNLVSEQQERKTRFLVCFLQVASWGWSGRVSLSTRLLIWYLFGTQTGTILGTFPFLFLETAGKDPELVDGTSQWLDFRDTYDNAYSGFISSVLKMMRRRPREFTWIVWLVQGLCWNWSFHAALYYLSNERLLSQDPVLQVFPKGYWRSEGRSEVPRGWRNNSKRAKELILYIWPCYMEVGIRL